MLLFASGRTASITYRVNLPEHDVGNGYNTEGYQGIDSGMLRLSKRLFLLF
ncbi:hypothetical protein [Mucilaginibacter dorajii]|uniref:hypothetical protein n=1 Tax=Mucilaginibacter dorajii TaxID=692994 RepID=UPI0021673CD1|nr:hypothetical protein [Mucilaginibacter dorajii]MCS3737999.1 hypothetical protein [Mucilaginibacter dorajii]